MNNLITVTINGKNVSCANGQNILELIRDIGVDIPAPCYHPPDTPKIHCRLCLVRIKGKNGFQTACHCKAEDGMQIATDSPQITEARKSNLKALFDKHYRESVCEDCIWAGDCELHQLARHFGLDY